MSYRKGEVFLYDIQKDTFYKSHKTRYSFLYFSRGLYYLKRSFERKIKNVKYIKSRDFIIIRKGEAWASLLFFYKIYILIKILIIIKYENTISFRTKWMKKCYK